jgi:uncharacterized membrane protein
MDSHKRSLAKTVSWRFIATIVTSAVVFTASYCLARLGKAEFAIAIGLIDTSIKFGAYFLHERMWDRSNYGRKIKPPDYEI